MEESGELGEIVRHYFQNLFIPGESVYEPVLVPVSRVVTDDDNLALLAPFTLEEFRTALFSMNSDKVPGPDGFNPSFYQHFWSLIGPDIYHTCST